MMFISGECRTRREPTGGIESEGSYSLMLTAQDYEVNENRGSAHDSVDSARDCTAVLRLHNRNTITSRG